MRSLVTRFISFTFCLRRWWLTGCIWAREIRFGVGVLCLYIVELHSVIEYVACISFAGFTVNWPRTQGA
jgi:hypothetical protein